MIRSLQVVFTSGAYRYSVTSAFRGVILLAGLKRSILVEVSGTSKERGTAGFTDLGGLLLNQLLTDR